MAKAKWRALEVLGRDRLAELTEDFGLQVADRRRLDAHLDALAGARRVDFAEVLAGLRRDELKDICVELGLDDSGRQKQAIADRIFAAVGASAKGASGADKASATNGAQTGTGSGAAVAVTERPAAASESGAGAKLAGATRASDIGAPYMAEAVAAGTAKGHVKQFASFSEASSFLWSIADLLRGDFKQYDFGR